MKSYSIIMILALSFLLISCDEVRIETAKYPEDALKTIEVENSEREIIVYGSHKVSDELVLFVLRGIMNTKDVWVAEVQKDGDQWKAKGIVQMNGPFEGKGEIQTVITNDKFGYEVGYMEGNVQNTDHLNVIEIEGIEDWAIWIK